MFRLPYIANLLRPLAKARAYCTALAVSVTLLAVAFALTASAQVVGTPTLGVARQGHTATQPASRCQRAGGMNAHDAVADAGGRRAGSLAVRSRWWGLNGNRRAVPGQAGGSGGGRAGASVG